MSGKYERYSPEFKRAALLRMESCRNVSALARELGIRRKYLYKWQAAFRSQGEAGLRSRPEPARAIPKAGVPQARDQAIVPATTELKQRVAELERQLGVKQMEIDFFKRTFEHVRGAPQTPTAAGAGESTKASRPGSRSKDRD
jgi:transposase-like protein